MNRTRGITFRLHETLASLPAVRAAGEMPQRRAGDWRAEIVALCLANRMQWQPHVRTSQQTPLPAGQQAIDVCLVTRRGYEDGDPRLAYDYENRCCDLLRTFARSWGIWVYVSSAPGGFFAQSFYRRHVIAFV